MSSVTHFGRVASSESRALTALIQEIFPFTTSNDSLLCPWWADLIRSFPFSVLFTSWLIIWVCFFLLPLLLLCGKYQIERDFQSHVAACCLATTVIDHDAAFPPPSLSLSLCLQYRENFLCNSSCLISQINSAHGLRQHPVLVTRLPRSFYYLARLCKSDVFLAAAQTGTDTEVIFHTLEIIHKLAHKKKTLAAKKTHSFRLLIMDTLNNESRQLWLRR